MQSNAYQLHLYSVPFVSTNTHTDIQGNISFCLQVDILQRSYNCSVTEDQSLTEHQEPLAVHLWADIPAFQLKIQPKTALVSHQRIRNRTLNNGYYSDTGFRPLSLRSFSLSLSFLFSCVYEKESKIFRENMTRLYVCASWECVFFCQPQFDSGTLLLTEEDTQQNFSTVYLTHT